VVVVRTRTTNKITNAGKKQTISAFVLVSIMIFSTQMYTFQNFDSETNLSDSEKLPNKTIIQQSQLTSDEPNGQDSQPFEFNPFDHAIFNDPTYHDPASYYGKISDLSALSAYPGYEFYLEETNTDDHDNDGIDDLNDLDDDNDGLNDLIERFDGCYGTDPFDHDNDGIQDELDWDDDNDGILEGPIDYTQGNDPRNVSSDRYLSSSVIHPWTDSEVGTGYLVDQNPFDHDNDGVPDEDIDGSGKGTYDEDDDNDARLDQFTWPCDFDGDGIQDYFDIDDDGDGVIDLWDEHPWDDSKTDNITNTAELWVDAELWASSLQYDISMTALGLSDSELTIEVGDTIRWTNDHTDDHSVRADDGSFDSGTLIAGGTFSHTFADEGSFTYSDTISQLDSYSGTVTVRADEGRPLPDVFNINAEVYGSETFDFVKKESSIWHPRDQSFTNIIDGDLDNDGLPNFIDPDNDNDGFPDSSDTDDDNDGLLDMYDVDDDNDGILDTCVQLDTNKDGNPDYPNLQPIGIPGIDCELDYDRDADDDIYRAIDSDYDLVWDWKDTDLGAAFPADNLLGNPGVDPTDLPYDLDNDGTPNEYDSFMNATDEEVLSWNCPSLENPNPQSSDDNCIFMRKSYTGNNDWDGDGFNNWVDVDDDNDGVLDWLDIDENCDLDDDNDLHLLNGSRYRDDGPNSIDTDIDGDGISNDEDWDDDNDGISDFYDPDDGNCGIVDNDATDNFYGNSYTHSDGDIIDGSADSQIYTGTGTLLWDMFWHFSPFIDGTQGFVLPYNGYETGTEEDSLTIVQQGVIPEIYWNIMMKWSPWNGNNYFDIDMDGDSLINGIDVDMDGDGMPDWWDQDEGNDGVLDVNDPAFGGSLDDSECGISLAFAVGQASGPIACGLSYAWMYGYPLLAATQSNGNTYTLPYSSRPDALYDDGEYDGSNSQGNNQCSDNCWWFTFDPGSNPTPTAAVTYDDIRNNRDLYIAYVGLNKGLFQWTADSNANLFPDEVADLLNDDVDPDNDCAAPIIGNLNPQCMANDTTDLDDDFDGVYDHWDIDDDNDGLWDYFEVDTDDDWDDDDETNDGIYYFIGSNCVDADDDGLDTDPDFDGWYQAVWDQGVLGQSLLFPEYYDVDNDNDGVPDGEDPDDDNNGILDVDQEVIAPQCFTGEEQSVWDHDNDGIQDWADDDWDADGINNTVELNSPNGLISAFDHDNDGLRDDVDEDDDQDGMKDVDEVLLWPTRFGVESTNPWDHDDFGNGSGIANPLDPFTGPDSIDQDDDADNRSDIDFDQIEEDFGSSDWDSNNNGILDADDKIPSRITLNAPSILWLDAFNPAIFSGQVNLLADNGTFVPTENIPVQVHIVWTRNGTTALETVDVLTGSDGKYLVGQFLFPEDISVGSNSTYYVYAEVTEMFIHDSAVTEQIPVEVRANTTSGYSAGTQFRSDEMPLKISLKTHYSADYDRGIFDNRISNAPFSFTVSDSKNLFGNVTHPTEFDGYGYGYRAGKDGWANLRFNQSNGNTGTWEQVQYNSALDNGEGTLAGGWEEILWNNFTKNHDVIRSPYVEIPTNVPTGDYFFVGTVNPSLGYDWPWPYLESSDTDSFTIRSMKRMFIESQLITPSNRPVYFYDSTQFTGSSFGAWRALFHAPSLSSSGLDFTDISVGKSYPILWDGQAASLGTIAGGVLLDSNNQPFTSVNYLENNPHVPDGYYWSTRLQNGASFDVPPCGAVDPSDPASQIRCEIVPEMFTGEDWYVEGTVWNRTFAPWASDALALQVDHDRNQVFAGSGETRRVARPNMVDGEARFEFNDTWYSQFPAGTFGIKTSFTNSDYYFTGNQTQVLAPVGSFGNISVIGTTDFQLTATPRLYRGQNATIEARLIDNAFQPVREVPVNYTWSADGSSDVVITDNNGVFKVNLTIDEGHQLGNFTLDYTYLGDSIREGNSAEINLWVVSRTFINLQSTTPNLLSSGDIWEFTAQVTDDNRTAFDKDLGQALSGCGDLGGEVSVILEGIDFEDRVHRQIVEKLCPNAGSINHKIVLNPQLLRDDPFSFLPDGFGPVNVILRFEENLPHEGCEPIVAEMLTVSGAWDSCVLVTNNDHFRKVMQFQVDGFSLIGRTALDVDDQIVYTSEIDPNTGIAVEKPMIVTGQLTDELGGLLDNRAIRVTYEMDNTDKGIVSCIPGITDSTGNFSIICPISGVQAGQAKVRVEFNSYENNDRYRYENQSVTRFFPVFSNSSLSISEIGPFRSDFTQYEFSNGSKFDVLYLKEAFHLDATLIQTNGNPIGGKCLNIYLDPQTNTRPMATIVTEDGSGEVSWYSGDPEDNPSRRGVEPNGNQLEGFRTIRVAYEPDKEIPGGCRAESNPVVNSSYVDVEVLVRSRVDILLKEHWSNPQGYQEGDVISGAVAILRDRLDITVEGEQVVFTIQYWNGSGWETHDVEYLITNEQGVANFSFIYTAEEIPGELEKTAEDGKWRVLVQFQESAFFEGEYLNNTPVIALGGDINVGKQSFFTSQILIISAISISVAALVGAVMYQNYRERRKIEVIRGILTDSLMALKASNNYIEAIFDCYKNLIKFFRSKGAMKKVFETTREFEDVISNMLTGVIPPEEMNVFFSIFEEARYSDHEIGSDQRDRAIQVLQQMITRITNALGENMLNRSAVNESGLYGAAIKAGEFIDSDGNVRVAGAEDESDNNDFRI
jgi:plastocyanin